MPDLGSDVVALLAIASSAISLVLLGVVLLLSLRIRKLRADHQRAFAGAGADVVGTLGAHAEELAMLRDRVVAVHSSTDQVRELQRGSLSRLGVVRYDAFDDMGGKLSFSAALLDEHHDGIIISAINGRTETRCYAKPVNGGASDQNLSKEELAAMKSAVEGRPPSLYPPEGRRRRRAS